MNKTRARRRSLRRFGYSIQAFALIALCLPLRAQNDAPPSAGDLERLGISQYAATAEPGLRHPLSAPCVVELFQGLSFSGDVPHPFAYVPPADCRAPWSKVVLSVAFQVTAGRQFDRTAQMWIGGATVYFGTTQEPSRATAPSWRVERDLTEYSELFTTAHPGSIELANLLDSTYTGKITASARLLFYRADPSAHTQAADAVLPLMPEPGATARLATPSDALEREFTLPRNIERAYLDVYPQSQRDDEFWYTCVPSRLAKKLETCAASSFREAEVRIDGQPAGVTPVFPWIYTGGIDPLLWRPVPAIQSLRFEPYRVDLTPFAGMLSDGKPHKVSLGVFNASNFFSISAALVLYLDHGSQQVTGGILSNTLARDPDVAFEDKVHGGADSANGSLLTTSGRSFRIAGYVNTSHGRVETELEQTLAFRNHQNIRTSPTEAVQEIAQSTTVVSVTRTRRNGTERIESRRLEFPLAVATSATTSPDKSVVQKSEVRQSYTEQRQSSQDGFPQFISVLNNEMRTSDTAKFDPAGARTGNAGQSAWQKYAYSDTDGNCYSRSITAEKGEIVEVRDGCTAP